ncbi:hypothetical protein PEC18_17870 [Paucibacter sp. O1-1]|nr:hypothetical protein [Paucibacter sp. O1-1]MDA3827667.1 hypothetical protein [Paucibacter sp. O1-1]
MATPPKTRRTASAATPVVAETAPVKKTAAKKTAVKAAAKKTTAAVKTVEKAAAIEKKKPAAKKTPAAPVKTASKAASKAVKTVVKAAAEKTVKKAEPVLAPVEAKKPAAKAAPAKKVAAKKVAAKKAVAKSAEPVVMVIAPAKKKAAPAKKVVAKPAAKQAVAKPPVAPEPVVEAIKPVAKKKAAAKPVARKPAAPAPVVPSPAPPARFALHRQGPWFGSPLQVELLATGQRWQVLLRGGGVSAASCSCAGYAQQGSCEHLGFALLALQDDAEGQAALVEGWQTEHSELWLQYGLRRQLHWHAGRHCPAPLRQDAEALIALPQDQQGDALPGLLALAAQHGHELRVDDAVWIQLAEGRDARQRMLRLAEAYQQGMASPDLRSLLKLPLPQHQLEAALFAACAGRALVADDLQLGMQPTGLAAAELMQRHFGVERVLLLCAESAQSRWLAEAQSLSTRSASLVWGDAAQRAQQWQAPAEIKIAALGALEQDLAPLQAWAPELVIVDEAQRLGEGAVARLQQLPEGFLLLLASQLPQEQPATLLRLVELLDHRRSGALAALHERHLRHDAQGQLLALAAPARLAQSLERVMLSRAGSELALPPALVQLRAQPLSAQQQGLQAALLAPLRRSVARWQRSAYLADAEQLQLLRGLQALRRLAISPALADAAAEGPAPRLEAVLALARELLAGAVSKLVVCSQWDDGLALLAARLQAAGLPCVQLSAATGLAERRSQAARWREDSRSPLLLCSDAAGAGLDLRVSGVGLISLELPWGEALLEQRLGLVAGEETHGLPLLQLLAQGGIESAMLALQDSWPEMPACGLDGDLSLQLLGGEALQRFMQALVALIELM